MVENKTTLGDLMDAYEAERIAAMNTPEALAHEAENDRRRAERMAAMQAAEDAARSEPQGDDERCDICGDDLNEEGDCDYCDGDKPLD